MENKSTNLTRIIPYEDMGIYLFVKDKTDNIDFEMESKIYRTFDGRTVTLKSINDIVIIDDVNDHHLMYEIDAFMDQDHYKGLVLIIDDMYTLHGLNRRLNVIFRNNSSIKKNKYWYGLHYRHFNSKLLGMDNIEVLNKLIEENKI